MQTIHYQLLIIDFLLLHLCTQRYSITKKCAQNLELHRANNGQYHSLEELLQVNGMNDTNLYKFYKSIVSGKKKKTSKKVTSDLVLTSKVTTDNQKV